MKGFQKVHGKSVFQEYSWISWIFFFLHQSKFVFLNSIFHRLFEGPLNLWQKKPGPVTSSLNCWKGFSWWHRALQLFHLCPSEDDVRFLRLNPSSSDLSKGSLIALNTPNQNLSVCGILRLPGTCSHWYKTKFYGKKDDKRELKY